MEHQMESDNLKNLIERAQHRDENALSELISVYTTRLHEFIRTELGEKLRQRLESQDVMQQVYLEALMSITQFVDRGHDSFFAWLKRIAINRICDVDRRAFKSVKRGGEVRAADLGKDASMIRLFDDISGSITSPSMAADFADKVRLLQSALDSLTPDHKEVIRLRYIHQLSVSETAQKMDRSERAVRSLCVRAIIHLRERLGDTL